MREIIRTAAFKREVKKMQRQGQDMRLLVQVFDLLAQDARLPERFLDHPLKGKWRGCRELHIAPDWLLVYHIENDTVFLDRTGSHAELFKR
jgi:mRNA interferase YafQ